MNEKITGTTEEEIDIKKEEEPIETREEKSGSADLEIFYEEVESKDPLDGKIDYKKLDINSYAVWYDLQNIKKEGTFENEEKKKEAIRRFKGKVERLKQEYSIKDPNYKFLDKLEKEV